MMPYADPRAYSDRLNSLFAPAGWTRRYTVQASAPVQRGKRGLAAKILVTCEVTIACIGTNSGTGEEWSDKENALTGAEAQAFKRALSCFGLGRYLHDTDGEWIELDQHGVPKKIPKLRCTRNYWSPIVLSRLLILEERHKIPSHFPRSERPRSRATASNIRSPG